jgi:glycosyltransferase involved in cell wall biosynthesis
MIKLERFSKGKPLSVVVATQQMGNVISGIGLYAHNLVEYLLSDGHHVCVIAPEDQRPSGLLPYTYVSVPRPIAGNTHARWVSLSISFARELGRLQHQQSIDLVHFTDGREALFCRYKLPMIGNISDTYAADLQPLSFYRHYFNDWLLRWGYYRFVHACEPVALRRLQAVIAASDFTAQVMADVYHIPKDHLHMCHLSIATGRYTNMEALREQVNPHPPRILFVGGNMQRKGLPLLIAAAPRVLEVIPDAEFWIAGKDKAEPFMKSLCKQTGVSERFRFFGWQSQDDMLNLYAQTDIFVLPSLTEAFGVVFLEAMASGLPVIGTRVGGIPEIIKDGVNGMLVENDNVSELATAIVQLLGNKNLQENLRQAGLATMRRFDISNMMQCTYDVYEKVLTKH